MSVMEEVKELANWIREHAPNLDRPILESLDNVIPKIEAEIATLKANTRIHDVEVVEAAFRLATRQLTSKFSAGVPEFTEALDRIKAEVREQALEEAAQLAADFTAIRNGVSVSPTQREIAAAIRALKGSSQAAPEAGNYEKEK